MEPTPSDTDATPTATAPVRVPIQPPPVEVTVTPQPIVLPTDPAEVAKLNALGATMNAQVEQEVALRLQTGTQRTLGGIICVAIFIVVMSLIVLVAVAVLSHAADVKDIESFSAVPISIGLSGLLAIASGIGIRKNDSGS